MTQKEYREGFCRGLEVALELAERAIGRVADPKVQRFLVALEAATNEGVEPTHEETQSASPQNPML